MAPPLQPFPVSELELRVHSYSKDFKEKSRKLPRDFDMERDCELFELVQYSCTTIEQIYEKTRNNPTAPAQMECFPFVRLFRRCGQGDKMFHVETTAWEGEHAWKPSVMQESRTSRPVGSSDSSMQASFANYAKSFWSQK